MSPSRFRGENLPEEITYADAPGWKNLYINSNFSVQLITHTNVMITHTDA